MFHQSLNCFLHEMGCLCTKTAGAFKIKSVDGKTDPKGYSWENKEDVDPNDFTIHNIRNETIIKFPSSIGGQQFIIHSCENSNIYVFDDINTVTVDDCNNCSIFLGPTKGSVFIRDCHECRILSACQQFRSRDCKFLDVFLCCATQPIVESCSDMLFGCFCYSYNQLEEQFRTARLSVFNNNWNNVHDFTPVEGEQNWSLLPKDARVEDFFPTPSSRVLSNIRMSTDPALSVVPQTCGYHQKVSHQSCLVVFFCDGHSQKRALSFIKEMEQTDNVLIRTKEITLEDTDAQRVFATDSYNSVVKRGPVIALEYNGDNCIQQCQETAKAIATETGCTGLVYVSNNSKTANKQIENFFNYADMQMSG